MLELHQKVIEKHENLCTSMRAVPESIIGRWSGNTLCFYILGDLNPNLGLRYCEASCVLMVVGLSWGWRC